MTSLARDTVTGAVAGAMGENIKDVAGSLIKEVFGKVSKITKEESKDEKGPNSLNDVLHSVLANSKSSNDEKSKALRLLETLKGDSAESKAPTDLSEMLHSVLANSKSSTEEKTRALKMLESLKEDSAPAKKDVEKTPSRDATIRRLEMELKSSEEKRAEMDKKDKEAENTRLHAEVLKLKLELSREQTRAASISRTNRAREEGSSPSDDARSVRRKLDFKFAEEDSPKVEVAVPNEEEEYKLFMDSLPAMPGRVRKNGMSANEQKECRKFMSFAGRNSTAETEPCSVEEFIKRLVVSGPTKASWIERIGQAQSNGGIDKDWTLVGQERRSREEMAMALVSWYFHTK